MNDEQKKQKKLEKWGRQISYTAVKIMTLSGRDMAQIKGNGLIITIKRWDDAVNDRKYTEEVTLSTQHLQQLNKDIDEDVLDDSSFEEEVKKIREGWKE